MMESIGPVGGGLMNPRLTRFELSIAQHLPRTAACLADMYSRWWRLSDARNETIFTVVSIIVLVGVLGLFVLGSGNKPVGGDIAYIHIFNLFGIVATMAYCVYQIVSTHQRVTNTIANHWIGQLLTLAQFRRERLLGWFIRIIQTIVIASMALVLVWSRHFLSLKGLAAAYCALVISTICSVLYVILRKQKSTFTDSIDVKRSRLPWQSAVPAWMAVQVSRPMETSAVTVSGLTLTIAACIAAFLANPDFIYAGMGIAGITFFIVLSLLVPGASAYLNVPHQFQPNMIRALSPLLILPGAVICVLFFPLLAVTYRASAGNSFLILTEIIMMVDGMFLWLSADALRTQGRRTEVFVLFHLFLMITSLNWFPLSPLFFVLQAIWVSHAVLIWSSRDD
jgi:hypothetical protein